MPMDQIPRIREMGNLRMWTLETPGMLGGNIMPAGHFSSPELTGPKSHPL